MNAVAKARTEREQIVKLEAQVRDLSQQLEWFKRQLFGRKSEQRLLIDPAVQPMLDGLVDGITTASPPPPTETSTYERRKKQRDAGCVSDEGLRFDAAVPVVRITLPVPADVGEPEVIGEDVRQRLAQRPGSYVVLKYVPPVVKRKADAQGCSWPAPASIWPGSMADVSLIAGMLRLGTGSEDSLGGGDIVMDFFGGSATTLQAVIEQNAEDGGQRRCIIVQLPEPLDGGGEALKTIADIGRARTRKGIENLKSKADLATASLEDVGFKSFLLTPSNFKQWRGDGIETAEALAEQMKMFVDGEKAGAEVEWKLYELLLKFGQELTTPIETLELAGGKVFAIRERQMLFVLKTFSEPMIQALLALKPREVIALDSVFQNSDPLKTNLDLQCRDAGVKFICL